jgi:hypothetical protein
MTAILAAIQERIKDAHREENEAILATRIYSLNQRPGPRCGDWLDLPDGTSARIAHHWGDAVQPSTGNGDTGSFYLGDGFLSYSGSLEGSVAIDRLQFDGEYRSGRLWFFSQDHHRAHNGVDFTAQFRVYRVTA